MKTGRWVLGAMLVTVSLNGFAGCGKDPECDDLSAWSAYSAFDLKFSMAGSTDEARWQGEIDPKTNDFLIHADIKGAQAMKGDVGMVAGRVMLSRGLELPRGSEIDAIDGPVLMYIMSQAVLKRVFAGGPASITREQVFDRTFDVGVKYATPSADSYIAPPWKVRGKAARSPDGITFEMSVTPAAEQGKTYTMNLAGRLTTPTRPVFDDAMSLNGWKTYGVGVQTETQGSSATYDFGAKPQASPGFKTVGDLRASVARQRAEEEYPGVKDATKDFTGFWKEKCQEPFGLQITHHGSEGKYIVMFCGPGGCGDPDRERETFITGDKHFKVVSEDEIVIGGDTHRRCTKDPHPILKY